MRITSINAGEEHSRYFGQVYQEHYARLRNYFLTQLSDASEADDCVEETIRRFFFFMEDRCWEADAEHIPVYLMRIAGGILCSIKSAKRARRKRSLGVREAGGLFAKVKSEVIQPLRERLEFRHLFLGAAGSRG